MAKPLDSLSSARSEPGGYVSLQDDLLIPPPVPMPSLPPKPDIEAQPVPERKPTLSDELQRRLNDLFGTSPPPSDQAGGSREDNVIFQPRYFFFYGALMDPDVLGNVLELEKTPILTRAKLKGFSIKLWEAFSALTPDPGTQTTGMIWKVDSKEHFSKLVKYETKAYAVSVCEVETDDGDVIGDCGVFRWNGSLDSPELKDADDRYDGRRNYFKTSMMDVMTDDK